MVPTSRPIRETHRIVPALQPLRCSLGQFSGTTTSTAIIPDIAATAAGAVALAAGSAAAATGVVAVRGAG